MPASIVERFATELKSLVADNLRFSSGSGKTAFNAYLATEKKRLALGVYTDGRIWTACTPIGAKNAAVLAEALLNLEIELETTNQWCWWKRHGDDFVLRDSDVEKLSRAVAAAVRSMSV